MQLVSVTVEQAREAMGGKTPRAWTTGTIKDTSFDIVGIADGDRLVSVWGLTPLSEVTNSAWAWGFLLDDTYRIKDSYRMWGEYLQCKSFNYRVIATVRRDEATAVRFAKRIGFKVDEELEKMYDNTNHCIMRYRHGG